MRTNITSTSASPTTASWLRRIRRPGTLTVNATSPFYNTNPSNQTTTAGSGTAFSVSVSGTPTPTIQWQVSADGGATWAPLSDGGYYSGTATNTLVVTNADFSINNYRYRTVATNTAGSLNSFAATLTVNRNPQTVNFSGGTVSINTPITLTPSATSGLTSFTYIVTGASTTTFTLNSGVLTVTGVGSVVVQANQAGNNFYAPASQYSPPSPSTRSRSPSASPALIRPMMARRRAWA